jgi:hypothetical protein
MGASFSSKNIGAGLADQKPTQFSDAAGDTGMCSKQTQFRALTAACFVLSLPGMTQLATAAPPTDACALLSQPQVATALGVEVDAGKHIIGAGDCRWTEQGKAAGANIALLQVNLMKPQAFEIGKTPISGWNKAPVTGIGDDAYVTENGKVTFPISPAIAVKKGTVSFVIIAKVPQASFEQTKALEKTIASKVLERL